MQNTRGGLGYVEYAYASRTSWPPSSCATRPASSSSRTWTASRPQRQTRDWANARHFAVNLIDQPGEKSWPIVSATFILLPKDPKDPARSANVMKFFDWAYRSGDAIATGLDYVPLPASVKDAVRAAWKADIKTPDGKPVL